jgi:hypothetical protein
MKLYLAGNFIIMADKKKEIEFQKKLGGNISRLCSFFYREETEVVMDIQKGAKNGKKKSFRRFK